MYAFVNIGADAQSIMPREQMVAAQHTTQGRMSIYPIVKPGDLIVEQEGVRWRVQNVSFTERLRSPVQQMLTLFRVPEGDIEHRIPVQWDDAIETSPRSFSPKSDL